MIPLLGTAVATPAAAAPGDAFDPADPTIFISQGSTTQLYRSLANPDGTFSFTPEGDVQDVTYNGIGYDEASGYIYAIVSGGNAEIPSGSLVRVGQEGVIERVGSETFVGPTGASNFQAGAVGDDGYYYIIQQNSNVAYRIDLATGEGAGEVELTANFAAPDFTFAAGFAWALNLQGQLIRVNMADGGLTVFPGSIAEPSSIGFGAGWTFGNGNLGFSDNATGAVYQFAISDVAAAQPTVELISVSEGPASSINDGTMVPGLPVDLAVEKTSAATHLVDDQVQYSITVRNLSDAASSGWSVTDVIPEGLGEPAVVEEVSTAYDEETRQLTVTGGRLEGGAEYTFTIVAESNLAAGECTENTATVIGNERDDVVDNDSDTAETCAIEPAIDFGDAPESYGTLRTDDGARHLIPDYDEDALTAPVMLGESIDAEEDGQPSPNADGDGADEDGVVFNPQLGYGNAVIRTGTDPVSLAGITNTLEVTATADGFVSVWVDWDLDGTFGNDERVVSSEPVAAGANDLTFEMRDNPDDISSMVRVRYSTDADAVAAPTGPAPDGEVEDYRVLVERVLTPNGCTASDTEHYAFTFSDPVERSGDGGAGTTALFGDVSVVNGQAVDMFVEVLDGWTNAIRRGNGGIFGEDDANWQIAGNASLRYSFFVAGTEEPIGVNAAYTVSDMDTGEIGTFAAADLASYAVTEGSAVQITEEAGEVRFRGSGQWNGNPESRFQIVLEDIATFESDWQGGSNSGFGFDGDGDLAIEPSCFDFGDAPASYGTMLEDDGARHVLTSGLTLGDLIDFDPDGQPSADARGDDDNRAADEDGVTAPIAVSTTGTTDVDVTAVNNTDDAATIAAWVDLETAAAKADLPVLHWSVSNAKLIGRPVPYRSADEMSADWTAWVDHLDAETLDDIKLTTGTKIMTATTTRSPGRGHIDVEVVLLADIPTEDED